MSSILLVGRSGSGKTAQIWTLPGRKFAYVFDPNSMATLRGCPDLDVKEYYPDLLEMDATLKGFNKGSTSDEPSSAREPLIYSSWIDDINEKVESKFFADYQWVCFDSITFITKAVMDRQLYINKRYGEPEDRADYKIVGMKLFDVFSSINSMPGVDIFATGHLDTYKDEHTAKVETQLKLPGRARDMFPLIFTNVWLTHIEEFEDGLGYMVRTRPDPKGLRDIRCTIQGLETDEDVTIAPFPPNGDASKYGIGALLARQEPSAPR